MKCRVFELGRLQYLEAVRGEDEPYFKDIIQWHLAPKICVALNAYRRDLKRVRDLIEQEKSHEEWLAIEARKFRKKSHRVTVTDSSLARDLNRIATRIEQAKRGTRSRLEQRWQHNLGIVHPIKGHTNLQQERQLDSQFQVRLGAILRTFMQKDPIPSDKDARGPSLRTVATSALAFAVLVWLVRPSYQKSK